MALDRDIAMYANQEVAVTIGTRGGLVADLRFMPDYDVGGQALFLCFSTGVLVGPFDNYGRRIGGDRDTGPIPYANITAIDFHGDHYNHEHGLVSARSFPNVTGYDYRIVQSPYGDQIDRLVWERAAQDPNGDWYWRLANELSSPQVKLINKILDETSNLIPKYRTADMLFVRLHQRWIGKGA